MIVSGATGPDVYALLDGLGIEMPRDIELRSLLSGLNAGPAWALRPVPSAPPIALLGIVAGDALVFWSRMGTGADRQLPAIVTTGRKLMRSVMAITGCPVEMWVASSNRAGQVMAAACGLVASGEFAIGKVEIWRTEE